MVKILYGGRGCHSTSSLCPLSPRGCDTLQIYYKTLSNHILLCFFDWFFVLQIPPPQRNQSKFFLFIWASSFIHTFFCILLVHSIPYQRIYLCLLVAAVGQKRVNKKPVLIVSQEMISIIFQRTSILKKNSQIISGGISTPPLKKVPLLCTYQHCDQEFFRRFTLYLVPPCPSVPNEWICPESCKYDRMWDRQK